MIYTVNDKIFVQLSTKFVLELERKESMITNENKEPKKERILKKQYGKNPPTRDKKSKNN